MFRTWIPQVLVLAATTVFTANTAGASWMLIDHFEGYAAGLQIRDVADWTVTGSSTSQQIVMADPAGAGNHVLRMHSGVSYLYTPATIADGDTGTLFFRFRVPDSSHDVSIGLTTRSAPSAGGDHANSMRLWDGELAVYDTGSAQTVPGSDLSADSWYNVWHVVDNKSYTWEAYVEGPGFTGRQQLEYGGKTVFDFRSGEDNLVNFYIRTNAGHSGNTAYLDDIYLNASSGDLSLPSLFWAPGAGAGGTGDWNSTDAAWAGTPDGSGTRQAWPGAGSYKEAVFAGTPGSVTIDAGGVAADVIRFTADGYTVDGGPLTLAGHANNVAVSVGNSAEIASNIAGSDGLAKAGRGTLTLSGDNSHIALTTVLEGMLRLSSPGTAVPGDLVVGPGACVTFAASNQIADEAHVTIAGRESAFNATSLTTGRRDSHIETIGSLTATGGSFLTGTNSTWTITGAVSFTGGEGDTAAVIQSGSTVSFGSLHLAALTSGTRTTPNSFGIAGNRAGWTTDVVIGSGGLTLDGSNLLVEKGTTGGTDGSRLILDGDVTTTGDSASAILWAAGDQGESTLQLSNSAGNVTRTFDIGGGADLLVTVDVTNGAADAAGLLKTGPGTLTLAGANTYTGGTTVGQGTLALSGNGSLSATGPLTLAQSGTALDISGITAGGVSVGSLQGVAGSSVVLGEKNLDVGGNDASTGFAGSISGMGGSFTKSGEGTMTLSGDNAYTGLTTVAGGGTLMLDTSTGTAVPGDLLITSGANVRFSRSNQIDKDAAVVMADSGSGFNAISLTSGRRDNHTETIASLHATGGVFLTGTGSTWEITGGGSFTGGGGNTAVRIQSGSTVSFDSLALTAMNSQTRISANSFGFAGNGVNVLTSLIVGSGGLTMDGSFFLLEKGSASNRAGSSLILDGGLTTTGHSASGIILVHTQEHNEASVRLSSTSGTHVREFNIGGGGADLLIGVDVINGAADTAGIRKTGLGTLTLAGENAYTGATTVEEGTLLVDGSLQGTSGVILHQGATLGGTGTIAAHVAGSGNGAGLISPGSSAGILTVDSIDPRNGMSFAFEFGGFGSPDYTAATDSINDVLRLTHAGEPAVAELDDSNAIDVYLGVADLGMDDFFRGGVYVDAATGASDRALFYEMVKEAEYNYFVLGDGAGTNEFGGLTYYTLAEHDSFLDVSLSIVAETADFGGIVNGAVMQFAVIPEPGTAALLAFGLLGLLTLAGRRRRIRVS